MTRKAIVQDVQSFVHTSVGFEIEVMVKRKKRISRTEHS